MGENTPTITNPTLWEIWPGSNAVLLVSETWRPLACLVGAMQISTGLITKSFGSRFQILLLIVWYMCVCVSTSGDPTDHCINLTWAVGTPHKMSTVFLHFRQHCRKKNGQAKDVPIYHESSMCLRSIWDVFDHSTRQRVPAHWQAHWSWFWEMAYKASQAWRTF